jgi:hypothetical protein
MRTLGQGMRCGVWTLLKSPALLVIKVLTVALGTEAHRTIFSLVNLPVGRSRGQAHLDGERDHLISRPDLFSKIVRQARLAVTTL